MAVGGKVGRSFSLGKRGRCVCGWQNHCEVVSVVFQQKAHSHLACVDSCWSLQEKRTTIKKGMAKYMAMAEATLGDEVWIGYLNRDSNDDDGYLTRSRVGAGGGD